MFFSPPQTYTIFMEISKVLLVSKYPSCYWGLTITIQDVEESVCPFLGKTNIQVNVHLLRDNLFHIVWDNIIWNWLKQTQKSHTYTYPPKTMLNCGKHNSYHHHFLRSFIPLPKARNQRLTTDSLGSLVEPVAVLFKMVKERRVQ